MGQRAPSLLSFHGSECRALRKVLARSECSINDYDFYEHPGARQAVAWLRTHALRETGDASGERTDLHQLPSCHK